MRRTPIAAMLAGALLISAACGSSPTGTTITILGYTVVIKTAPPATAQVGTSVPVAFTVTENRSDGSSQPASGKSFTVTVTAGGGTVNGATSATLTTGADGSVSLTWLLGSAVGTQSVRGSVAADKFLDVNVVATAPPATQLALSTAPSGTAQNGVVFTQQPTVQLKDAGGNAVAQAGVLITVAIDVGGGTLGGGSLSVSTNASGAAVYSGLMITGLIGTRTLKFTATLDGIQVNVTAPVAVTPGAFSQLALTTAPSATGQSGVLLAQQPTVQLRDLSGNAVAQAGVSVTASITAGGGALGGTLTVSTNSSGAAVFSGLFLTGNAGARTLKFATFIVLTEVSVNAATAILPGLPSQLTLTTQPSLAAAGIPLSPGPAVQLRDPSGAAVSQAGVVVTASIAAGFATLGGVLTATTDASGVASFTNLLLIGQAGPVSLRLSAVLAGTGLTSVVTNSIALSLPGNGKIAFVTGKEEIWVVDPNGTNLTQLTPGYGVSTCHASDMQPAWSPNGSKIAFVRTENELTEIWVMNANGSNQIRLTFTASPGSGCVSGGGVSKKYNEFPSWSPDGTRIIYTSDQSATADDQDIWIMNADGTNQVKLFGVAANKESGPVFSRDGLTIAFGLSVINANGTGCRGGTDGTEIWLLNADGSNPRRHTTIAGCSIESDYSWTLDGQKIYFSLNKSTQPCDVELFSVSSDPLNLNRTSYTSCSFGNASDTPRVSPDGTKILYHAVGGGGVLRTMLLDGSSMVTVGTGGKLLTISPSWQPIVP